MPDRPEEPKATSINVAQYVDAVRQRHVAASEQALLARLALADEYLQADLANDAVDLLTSSAIDGHRIWGPADARTFAVHLDLGDALLWAGRPLEALAEFSNVQVDLDRVLGADHPLTRRCVAAMAASTTAYEAMR